MSNSVVVAPAVRAVLRLTTDPPARRGQPATFPYPRFLSLLTGAAPPATGRPSLPGGVPSCVGPSVQAPASQPSRRP